MSRIIVIQFTSLDGVVHDPDGAERSAHGGWAFRHGPQAVAGDKFRLGALLDTGALLLGRRRGSASPASGPPATMSSPRR